MEISLRIKQCLTVDPGPIRCIAESLDKISQLALAIGIKFTPYTPHSLASLKLYPESVLKGISDQLNGFLSLLSSIDPGLPKEQFEKNLLNGALTALNLEVPDDFLPRITDTDICEIYDLDSKVQIFRNLEFLKYCSYDLATILSHAWSELFYRDPEIDTAIQERARSITLFGTKTESWMVKDHILFERLHKENKQFQLNLGHIAPAINKTTGERKAWISTVKVIPLGSVYQNYPNVRPI